MQLLLGDRMCSNSSCTSQQFQICKETTPMIIDLTKYNIAYRNLLYFHMLTALLEYLDFYKKIYVKNFA